MQKVAFAQHQYQPRAINSVLSILPHVLQVVKKTYVYIGMTTRKLHDCAREHILSARKKVDKTALAELERNSFNARETFHIVKKQSDLLSLHVFFFSFSLKMHQLSRIEHEYPCAKSRAPLSPGSPTLLYYLDILCEMEHEGPAFLP